MARSLATTLLAAVAGVSLAACVDTGNEAVVILQNQAPETSCAPGGSVEDVYRPSGRIDVATRQGYVFTPVAKNFSVAETSDEARRIAFVQGARVDLRFLDADLFSADQLAAFRDAALTRFEVPFSAMIEPGGTTSMVFEIIPAQLITDEIAPELAEAGASTIVMADVRLFGRLGNSDFESETFSYPVEVCNGCLVNVLGECNTLSTEFEPTHTGSVCNPAQDEPVDCCSANGSLICPAVGTMVPPQ